MKAVTLFLAIALLLSCLAGNAEAQRKAKPRDAMKLSPPVKVGRADIGGVVSGLNGPEAGVWVIAETTGLPTQYAKVVVTDDKGRYMIPGLPKAKYSLWVRGYGLVDSAKVPAMPGKIVYLTAVAAPSPKEAAQYYPAQYWFSLLRVPESSEFPLGPVASQGQWLNTIKTGACQSCHALGTPGMRTVPKIFMEKGDSVEAWRERLKSGGAMALMARDIGRLDGERAIKLFAEWTDRIAAGELPFAQPERPKGIERNVVVTLWDWSQPTAYLHDAVSTDRRNPRVNANGKIYGSPEDSTDYVPVLDPKRNSTDEVFHPVRDPETPSSKVNPPSGVTTTFPRAFCTRNFISDTYCRGIKTETAMARNMTVAATLRNNRFWRKSASTAVRRDRFVALASKTWPAFTIPVCIMSNSTFP